MTFPLDSIPPLNAGWMFEALQDPAEPVFATLQRAVQTSKVEGLPRSEAGLKRLVKAKMCELMSVDNTLVGLVAYRFQPQTRRNTQSLTVNPYFLGREEMSEEVVTQLIKHIEVLAQGVQARLVLVQSSNMFTATGVAAFAKHHYQALQVDEPTQFKFLSPEPASSCSSRDCCAPFMESPQRALPSSCIPPAAGAPGEPHRKRKADSSTPVTLGKRPHVQLNKESAPSKQPGEQPSSISSSLALMLSIYKTLVSDLTSADDRERRQGRKNALDIALEGIKHPAVYEDAWDLLYALFQQKDGCEGAKDQAASWLISEEAALQKLGNDLIAALVAHPQGYRLLTKERQSAAVFLATASCLAVSQDPLLQQQGMRSFASFWTLGYHREVGKALNALLLKQIPAETRTQVEAFLLKRPLR